MSSAEARGDERRISRRPGARAFQVLTWLPAAAILVYLLRFAVQAPRIIDAIYANADASSGPVLAHAATASHHGEILLGNYPWYEALWIQALLVHLPAARLLIEAGPFVAYAVTGVLVAWTVLQATGDRWAAAMTAVISFAAAPIVWLTVGAWTVHGLTWLHVALLGVLVVWVHHGSHARRTVIIASVATGAVSGVAVASDLITILAGVVPLAVVAVLSRRRPTVMLAATTCIATAAVVAVGFTALMHALDVRGAGTLPIKLAAPDQWGLHAHFVWDGLTALSNGDRWRGYPLGLLPAAHVAAAVAGLTALVATVVAATRVFGRLWSGLLDGEGALVVFWATGAVGVVLVLCVTSITQSPTCSRYLIGVLLAVAALAPTALRGVRARACAGLVLTGFVLVGTLSIQRGEILISGTGTPGAADARALAALAKSEHVGVAYSGYWDAMPLTWNAKTLNVYPLRMCDDQGRPCAFEYHRASSWYRPRPNTKSMLVVDRTIPTIAVTVIDPKLGHPQRIVRIGQLTVAIYDHDIASTFGPPFRGPQ